MDMTLCVATTNMRDEDFMILYLSTCTDIMRYEDFMILHLSTESRNTAYFMTSWEFSVCIALTVLLNDLIATHQTSPQNAVTGIKHCYLLIQN